jgi:hypothetical protein
LMLLEAPATYPLMKLPYPSAPIGPVAYEFPALSMVIVKTLAVGSGALLKFYPP